MLSCLLIRALCCMRIRLVCFLWISGKFLKNLEIRMNVHVTVHLLPHEEDEDSCVSVGSFIVSDGSGQR
jgi:hypothetical protein